MIAGRLIKNSPFFHRLRELERKWESRLPFLQVRVKRERYFYWVIGAIFLLFIGAYVHNNNIAFIVMFSIGVIGSWAIFLGRLNLAHLSFQLVGFERAFANREFKGVGKLSTSKPAYDLHLPGGEVVPVLKGERQVLLTFQFPRRGEFPVEQVVVWSQYPLYLATFSRRFLVGERVVVYPEPKGVGLEERFQLGRSFLGERGEFDGIREYQQGDTIRDLHWGSVAKGRPMSKKFLHHSREGRLVLDYDSLEGGVEERLSQLTKWVLEGEERGIPFTLRLPNRELRSEEGIEEILTALAKF